MRKGEDVQWTRSILVVLTWQYNLNRKKENCGIKHRSQSSLSWLSSFIKDCLTSCQSFSVRQVTPLTALSAGFPSHSMKFLGKYQFFGAHSFSDWISKQKDKFLYRETSSRPDWLQFHKLLFKCLMLKPRSQTFRYTDKNIVRIA